MEKTPRIMAHRGSAEHYPENSLAAFDAAIREGADAIELDVQFCQDGTPIVFHDDDLERLTGISGNVAQTSLDRIRELSAHEPARFAERFRGTPIPTLAEAAAHLGETGAPEIFVEIKRDTLPWHDTPRGVQAVLKACEVLDGRYTIISFDERLLREVRSLGKAPVGLVLSSWDANEWERATALEPEFLFTSDKLLPPAGNPLWEGPWQWVVYEINEPEQARALGKRGVDYIETRDVEKMRKALR